MRDQIKRLEELQGYDAQIQELQTALSAIPAKLEATQTDLARVEGLLSTERAQLAEAQRYYNEQRSLLEIDENQSTNAKTKLSAAKNSKEFVAAQREIEQSKESVSNRQAEIAKLVEAVAAKEKVLEERTSDVKTLRDSVEKDSDVARGKQDEIEGKIATIKLERDKVAKHVRPDVLKKYSAIRMRRGLAMVPVANGSCRGCNMNIPPQLYNVLQRGTTVEICPYCHRIIYWEELMKEPAAEGAIAAGAAPVVTGTKAKAGSKSGSKPSAQGA